MQLLWTADLMADDINKQLPADDLIESSSEKPDIGRTPNNNEEPKGYWTVSSRTGEDSRSDIDFKVRAQGCPADQQSLKNRIEKTLSAIKRIYLKDERDFNEAFSKLLGLAQVGLVGLKPSTAVADAALDSLQAEIVDREAGRIKNEYMLKLGAWAASFACIATIAYFILGHYPSTYPSEIVRYRTFFLLWTGCMAGAWCSFASRKVILTFFDLSQLEEDRVDPPLRLIFAGLLTSILGLAFVTGFANIVIGTFEGAKILNSGATALLAGSLAGLSEKALPAAVMQRAELLFKSDRK